MQWARAGICLIVLLAFAYEVAQGSSQQSLISRYLDRSRSTRGIKNGLLNSARGFGKRSLHTVDKGKMPVEWMADEIASNPELARLLVRQFIDLNKDGFLSTYELLNRPAQNDDSPSDSNYN